MDFPNISSQRGHQLSSRGGYPVTSSTHYYGSVESSSANVADGLWSPRNDHNNHYRYAPSIARDNPIAPYRYQNRSRRPPGAEEDLSAAGRRALVHDRVVSDRYEQAKKPAFGGSFGGVMQPRTPDDYYGNDEHFYPSVQDHYPGKSLYDPEVPSLVGSEHSFELNSDDDDENAWDRKIRPEEKMDLMAGYLSEDENDRYYYAHTRSTEKPRIPPVVAVAANSAPKQQIEVAPGEWLPLRGAQETWAAVQNDFYMPTECVCCQQTIFCIQDAAFVLCPQCKVVSPGFSEDSMTGGVGLGFVMEELAKWQKDIERSCKEAAKRM